MSVLGDLRTTVAVARERNLTFLAAGVVYHVFTSIPPLLLVALAVGSALLGPSFATTLVDQVSNHLSSSGERLVEQMLRSEDGRTGAGVVGVVVVAWSALKLFRGLDIAFDEVYEGEADTSLAEQVRDGVVVAVATGAVVALLVVTGTAFAAPTAVGVPFARLLGPAALVVGLTLAFLPVFYVFPPVEMSVRRALPGAALAAVGWTVLEVLFGLYAASAGRYAAYGILGAVLLFVTWLYFAGIVVLLGAALNAVAAGDTAPEGPRSVGAGRRSTATGDAPRGR